MDLLREATSARQEPKDLNLELPLGLQLTGFFQALSFTELEESHLIPGINTCLLFKQEHFSVLWILRLALNIE